MSEIDVSIIIVSFNTSEILRNCLDSIASANLEFSYEIIVVDNASTDSSTTMIEQCFPEIILIKNNLNLMFAKANNIGIKKSTGKYVLLLNSDTIVCSTELEKLVTFLKKNPNIAAVGPRVLNLDGSIQSESFPFDSLYTLICSYLKLLKWSIPNNLKIKILPDGFIGFQKGITRKTGWISGCCMLIDRNKIQNKVGYLDEELLFYGEDVEWCYRAKKNNEFVYIHPDSCIIHLGGASTTGNMKLEIEKNTLNNYILFSIKTIGVPQIVAINIIILITHLLISPILLFSSSDFLNKWSKTMRISFYILRRVINKLFQ